MKKIISAVLAICMVIAIYVPVDTSAATTVASGTCGNNVVWVLDDSGELVVNQLVHISNRVQAAVVSGGISEISTDGDMYNYNPETAPWYEYRYKIKSIVIKDGVTFCGNYSFYNCSNVTSVSIASTVTEIGYDCFKNCSSLKSITIPDKVTIIGSSAFDGCTALAGVTLSNKLTKLYQYIFTNCKSLKEVTINDGATSIDSGAFTNCSSLKRVYIPKSVTAIGSRAFYGCSNLSITYEGSESDWNNISIDSSNNSILSKCSITYLEEDEIDTNATEDYYEEIDEEENDEYEETEYEEDIIDELSLYISYEIDGDEAKITMEASEDDAVIYYTLDDEEPDEDSDVYKKPIYVYDTVTVKAFAYLEEYDLETEIVEVYVPFDYEDEEYEEEEYEDDEFEEEDEDFYYIECPHCGEEFEETDDVYDDVGYIRCPYCDGYVLTEIEYYEDDIEFNTSDWAADEVWEAYENDLIPYEMFEDALYKTISREEFAAIAVKLYENIYGEIPYVDIYDTPFTDCNYESEYNDYIAAAYELGITYGTTNTTFSPYENITREQLVAMLSRVIMPPHSGYNLCMFADYKEISEYATFAVHVLYEYDIVQGVGNNYFAPKETATKEQAIAIALRMYNSYTEW